MSYYVISFVKPQIYYEAGQKIFNFSKIEQKPDVGTMIYPTPCL